MAIYQTYTVKQGDTLKKIADAYGTDIDSIARWSNLANRNLLKIGQVLNVRQISETYYQVARGDTLSAISSRFNVTMAELQRVNGIANPSKIAVGARLIIPTAAQGPTASSISPARPLGSLSKKYEVAGDGPGTVSKGKGDHGGVSYGSYQLSSKFNRPQEFLAAEGKPWAAEFGATVPATEPFSAIWKAIAKREPARFEQAQHDYIQRTHYDVQAKRITALSGLDIKTRSRALQDVAWSTAVQFGPGSKLIGEQVNALGVDRNDPGFEKALIIAIYAERGRRDADGGLHYFKSSSPEFQAGVAARFRNELKDALDMLSAESSIAAVTPKPVEPAPPAAAPELAATPPAAQTPGAPAGSATDAVKRAATRLSDDDVRLILEKYGDHEANADFLAGNRVLISLRNSTNTRQFRKGAYDDLLLIVQRATNGSVKLLRLPINTEPAGEYAFDGTNKQAGKLGSDTDGDGRKELGRLVAGTYHYVRQGQNFMNAPFFKARNVQVTERDTNQDGNFTPGAGDTIDATGAQRTMYIHRGGAEGVATWSAGCQTIPKNRYTAFLDAMDGQNNLSYVLINAS